MLTAVAVSTDGVIMLVAVCAPDPIVVNVVDPVTFNVPATDALPNIVCVVDTLPIFIPVEDAPIFREPVVSIVPVDTLVKLAIPVTPNVPATVAFPNIACVVDTLPIFIPVEDAPIFREPVVSIVPVDTLVKLATPVTFNVPATDALPNTPVNWPVRPIFIVLAFVPPIAIFTAVAVSMVGVVNTINDALEALTKVFVISVLPFAIVVKDILLSEALLLDILFVLIIVCPIDTLLKFTFGEFMFEKLLVAETFIPL
jgi:hypothetical protein